MTSPTALSSIDWSIFKDGKDDAFGWLLHNNATVSATGSGGVTNISIVDSAGNALPLDDIEVDGSMVGSSAMGKIQCRVDNAATTTAANVAQSDTRVPVAQLRGKPQDLSSLPIAKSTSTLSDVCLFDDKKLFDDGSCKHFGDDKKEVGGKNLTVFKLGMKRGSCALSAQSAGKKALPTTHGIRAKCKASASIAAKSKRPLQRKKSGAALPTSDDYGLVQDLEKKQIRRVKNLVSVREFRKRKTKQLEQNEARLRRLEADNMDLKMRLKIGKEAILGEQREKQQIKEQMREMLQRNANEQEIAQFLNMYKVTYSDYGPKRREKLRFHLSRIRELLLPTQVTKLSLYSVEQGVKMLRRDIVLQEDPMSAPESATATVSLWGILADELEVTDEQQQQILERRAAIKKVRDALNHTLSILQNLEEVIDQKNTALEAQVAQLQRILTPSQATKFIIWVKENPAFMYMLDKLVDSTLQNYSSGTAE